MDKRILSIAMGALFAAGTVGAPVMAQQYGSDTQQPSGQTGAPSAGQMDGPSSPASSGVMEDGSGQHGFSQVDKDGDLNVSKSEAEDAGLDTGNWSQADRDSDGVLDEAEFAVFTEQQSSSQDGSPDQPGSGSSPDGSGSMGGTSPGDAPAAPARPGETGESMIR